MNLPRGGVDQPQQVFRKKPEQSTSERQPTVTPRPYFSSEGSAVPELGRRGRVTEVNPGGKAPEQSLRIEANANLANRCYIIIRKLV